MTPKQVKAARERAEALLKGDDNAAFLQRCGRERELVKVVPAFCDDWERLTLALATVTRERNEARGQLAQIERGLKLDWGRP